MLTIKIKVITIKAPNAKPLIKDEMLSHLRALFGCAMMNWHGANMEINVLIEDGLENNLEMRWLQSVAGQALIAEKVSADAELGLVITSQERVRQLNRYYLGKDRPTDVLAFAMLPEPPAEGKSGEDFPPFVTPPDGILHLGEVIIAYPQAVIQAKEHRHSVKKEIAILIIHGVLHLLGYDHDKLELERRMRAREAEILNQVEVD